MTIAILISALGGLTTGRSWRPESTSLAIHLRGPRRAQRCVLGKESATCRMDPMLIRRNNWRVSSFWNSLPLTPHWNGLRDAREHPSGQWKSARWRPKRSGGGSQGEWNPSGGQSTGGRARSARDLRPVGGLSFREYARSCCRGGRAQRGVAQSAEGVAAGWPSSESRG